MIRKGVCCLFLSASILFAQPLPIRFSGNDYIDDRALYEALGLHKPYAYEFWKNEPAAQPDTAVLLGETLKDFYKSSGYYDAVIRPQVKEGVVRFEIRENKPILISDVSTISVLDIRKKIPFSEGQVFDARKFVKSKSDIAQLYADNSYCNMQLDAKAWIDTQEHHAYLFYDVSAGEPCLFGPVTIHSGRHIEPKIIASLLHFREGDVYSPEKIRLSYDSLYGQEGIAKTTIDSSRKTRNTVLADVSVTEYPKPLRLKTGAGFSSDEGAMALLGLMHRNLLGNLKTASFDIRYAQIRHSVKANFDMPLERHSATGLEIGYENEIYEGFKEQRTYETLFVAHSPLPHRLKESVLFDQTVTYDSEDPVLFAQEHFNILSPKLQWSYDVRDKLLDPTRGFMLGAEVQGSLKSSVSDASYYRALVTGATIISLKPSILALRARYGSLRMYEGRVPPSYRFYAGGMNSNRAYGYRKLGPVNADGDPTGFDSVFTGTVEYRFPVTGNFKGVVFNDTTFIGNSSIPDYDKGYFAAGVGVRYLTPIGPLAIDVGVDVEQRDRFVFHFHVGELF